MIVEVICDCTKCENNENGYCTVESLVIDRDGECMSYDGDRTPTESVQLLHRLTAAYNALNGDNISANDMIPIILKQYALQNYPDTIRNGG